MANFTNYRRYTNYNKANPYNKKPKATDKYKNYEYGDIAVTIQPGKGLSIKEKLPYKIINLYNVDAESAKEIVARLKDTTKPRVTRNAWIDDNEPTHVLIKVLDRDIDEWLDKGELNAVQSVLIKSGNYDNNEIMHLEDEIATGFYSKNKEIIGKAHSEATDNAMDMWQKYLSKVNDPTVLEQLKLYSRVYGNTTYGHMLSIKNASLIKSYDPDATFVLAAGQWKNLFGRGIKRNAKPLPMFVWVPNREASQKDIEAAKNDSGWEDTDTEDLSTQVGLDVKYKANTSGGFTLKSVGYDVKDTYLLSGAKEDKWNNEIGLLNNLNGELNVAAMKHKAEKGTEDTKDIEGQDEMTKRTEKAVTWMETFMQENGYDATSTSQDPSNKLADYLLTYCTANATKKANILSQNNIRVYAENATQVTLILTNLGLNALKRFHATYTYDKKEAAALMNVVFGIAKKLEENSVLSEGIISWIKDKITFFKMFVKALRQIGCTVVNQKPEEKTPEANVETPAQEDNAEMALNEAKKNFKDTFNKINQRYF